MNGSNKVSTTSESAPESLIKSTTNRSCNPDVTAEPCSVAVFFSGRGSNFTALARYAQVSSSASPASYKITHVFTDNPHAGGLATATELGIPATILERKTFPSKQEFFQAFTKAILAAGCDLVVLAGFMRLLPPEFTDAFSGKIINIHPALLPKFPGLHTHERALAEGVNQHGCTVHFVDSGMDTGPMIAQAAVGVDKDDSVETLAAKVLAQEHLIFPWVVNQIAAGRIWLESNRVRYAEGIKEAIVANGWLVPGA